MQIILKYICKIDDCVLFGSSKDYTLTLKGKNCFGSAIPCKVFHKMLCHRFCFTSKTCETHERTSSMILLLLFEMAQKI